MNKTYLRIDGKSYISEGCRFTLQKDEIVYLICLDIEVREAIQNRRKIQVIDHNTGTSYPLTCYLISGNEYIVKTPNYNVFKNWLS